MEGVNNVNTDKQGFGNRLKIFFKEQNIKQRDIAQFLKVTPTAVSDWFSEKNRPSINIIEKLAERYDLSPTWLITGKEERLIFDNTSKLPLGVGYHHNIRIEDLNINDIDLATEWLQRTQIELVIAQKELIKCQKELLNTQKDCIEKMKKGQCPLSSEYFS